MTIKSLHLALALLILAPHSYADSFPLRPVSSTQNDVTITATAITAEKSLDLFGKKLWDQSIYPIRVEIKNQSNKAITFSSSLVTIPDTTILTPKTLADQIKSMSYVSAFTGFLLFPITLIAIYAQNKLIELMPIIHEHSSGDKPLIIAPNASLEIYLFADVRGKKNDDKNAKDLYIKPSILDTAITLQSDGWIMKNNTTFNLPVALK
jgi:hypothetical protein